MNRYQNKIHKLVKYGQNQLEGTDYGLGISYEYHRVAWKEDLIKCGYTKRDVIETPLEKIIEDITELKEDIKIENLLNKFYRLQKEKFKLIGGIIYTKNELSNDEFNSFIDSLFEKSLSKHPKIAVIDSKFRKLNTISNVVVADSLDSKLIENIQFNRDKATSKFVNILHLIPEYVVFRDLINESNIDEIIKLNDTGHTVIAFSNFTKKQLVKIYSKKYKSLSTKLILRIFSHIYFWE